MFCLEIIWSYPISNSGSQDAIFSAQLAAPTSDEGGNSALQPTLAPLLSAADGMAKADTQKSSNASALGFEATLSATAEGENGGQAYTACCIIQLLLEMLEPCKCRVFSPCCSSGVMFFKARLGSRGH